MHLISAVGEVCYERLAFFVELVNIINGEAMYGEANEEGKVDIKFGDEGDPESDTDIRGFR